MDYGRMARKKKDVCCPYCGSRDVHPLGRSVERNWTWECVDCKKQSFFGYKRDDSGGMRGITLYQKVCL
jgi:hypothetical protein